MNGYKHAGTTALSRALIIERTQAGWIGQAIAESLGISRRTACKADTTARIGSYSFTIEHVQYLEWLEALKQKAGFEKKDIIEELKKRLGL